MAYQQGSIYLHNGTWYLKYRIPESKNGTTQRVHKTERLCARNGEQHHSLCDQKAEHRSKKSVCDVRDKFMAGINAQQSNGHDAQADMSVADFWETRYLPYCEHEYKGVGMKPSTIRGFKQIWRQHLKAHFADLTLQGYTPDLARRFLGSIKTTQSKNTLKHVRALGSALFNEAIERGLRKDANPWHVKLPKDCKDTEQTQHYTLEEAENIVSALVEHPDAQLVIALACFLGLRPGEVAALRWEDFDADSVHIRRSVVRGHVGTPKTTESVATLPLIDQVRVPLELWREKNNKPKEGWVFKKIRKTGEDVPSDLHNVISRVIIPHVNGADKCIACDKVPKKSGVVWKGLYAGRRGAATAIIGVTNGNYAAAQELLRHKSMNTTLQFYKKQTKSALADGLKEMQKALSAGAGEKSK